MNVRIRGHRARQATTAWRFALTLLLIASAAPALAVTFPEKPPNTDFFVDRAELLDEIARKAVNDTAGALLGDEQIPVFVVTIPSLSAYEASGMSIERYARRLFDHWGLGSQARNYGILLLVAVGNRKARIELGAGFGHEYDAQTDDIMQSLIIPAFRRGDFALGITDGVRGLDAMARGLQLPEPTAPWWILPAKILGAVFLGFAIFNLFRTGRSGWAWALIGMTVAVAFFALRAAAKTGGFGGGFSGGGGATGSW